MGQVLAAIPTAPTMLRLEITCDGDHGLLPAECFILEGQDYIVMRGQARDAGWRKSPGPNGWRGPCCGGKVVESE